MCADRSVPADPLHHLGTTILADHRRLLHRCGERAGVGRAGDDAAVGHRLEVRIAVLQSYYSNDLYSALQVAFQGAGPHNAAQRNSGMHGFWVAIVTFCVLATIHVARIVFDTYLAQHFIIRWRVWLTDRLTTNWLAGRAYYRGRFVEPGIDNPDQRIQQDIDVFTTGVGTGPNVPTYYSQSHRGVRCGGVGGLGGVVHRHPVEAVGTADGVRRRYPEGAVLDRASPTC